MESTDTMRIAALEHQLRYLQQQQEMLLYTLSHDLRTPVMTILGFADMLISDMGNGDEQPNRQFLEHIRNSATRQAALIESLLSLSRLARQPLQPESLNLTQIAFDYWQSQSGLAENKGLAVKLLATPPAVADRKLLTEVIHALLGNALKFTAKQAHIEISFGAEQSDGAACYYVRDNGVGFDSLRAERLFHPFRRLHSARDYEGLGMGLATAAMIVQRHQGRLWADSTVGQGTTMRFTLGSV